ncbi:Acetylornithine aminotransferase [Labilithrix luteola]|uniref:Acetylornithine aminotransferase n=1 Tax=Labilithrix luteola TaxID=1391654 RepID=A0A0K1PKY4_9BACT|nr:Acetylornithine aminotransferase [Labilithrix luteola]
MKESNTSPNETARDEAVESAFPLNLPADRTQSRALIDELGRYVVAEPRPFAIDLAKSEGMYLATVDGDRICDWAGYFGAKLVAHNHPRLYEPSYVQRLVVAANNKVANPDFLTPECVAYYRELASIAPRAMRSPSLEIYVVNSGAEAVENMMKYLINLHHERLLAQGKRPGARRFVHFDQAFHGRTIFALNVTRLSHDPVMTKDFEGLVGTNIQVPFPAMDSSLSAAENAERERESLKAIEEAFVRHGDEIVSVIVEPLQGAGGHRVATPGFFAKLSALCHLHGVQLGFDEVQTAGGQTGSSFAIDAFDLPHPPQAVAAGKKLGNGVVYMQRPMRDHGVLDSTWGGTLADMVRFVQEMAIVRDEKLVEQVPEKTAHLVDVLTTIEKDFPELVTNIRGYGLYQGFTLRAPIQKGAFVTRALEEERTLLLGAGSDSIRLRPHLHVTSKDIDDLGKTLRRVLQRSA